MKESSRAEQDVEARVARRHAAEAALSLDVTLLGDGRGTPEYQKRLELQERLQRHPFVSHVTIPEVLRDRYPDASADEVERSAIEQADIVLCLEGPRHLPLGLYTEIISYFGGTHPDKWFCCRPVDREQVASPEPLVAALARPVLKSIDTFDYDPGEWETCGRITTACEERIERVAHRILDQQLFD